MSTYDFLAPPAAPDEIGRLGPYRILRVLGRGGMGVVFHAEDTLLHRAVALKVMLPAIAADPANHERFLREARNAAAVSHDHVVAIFQVGEERGIPYLVMPLLAGESLAERLARRGALPPAEVLRIGREIAEGLAAAHDRGLIHRDIKPANVWLEGPTARVKILDFGLARAARSAGLTQSGALLGTPAYMAPEQARGGEVDARADLFSLGCVIYQMASGRLPFPGEDVFTILTALATRTPPPLHTVNPLVPPGLSDLVLRLLARSPTSRPASARAVSAFLARLEHNPTADPALDLGPAPAPAALESRLDPDHPLTPDMRSFSSQMVSGLMKLFGDKDDSAQVGRQRWHGFVQRHMRRGNRNLLLSGMVWMLPILLVVVSGWRYFLNCVAGPIPLTHAEVATYKLNPERYVAVEGDDVQLLGAMTFGPGGPEQERYLVMPLKDEKRLLFIKAAPGAPPQHPWTGTLEVPPHSVRENLRAALKAEHPEVVDEPLTLWLNASSTNRGFAWFWLIVLSPFGFMAFRRLSAFFRQRANPALHPTLRALERFGRPSQVVAAIEAELDDPLRRMGIGPAWLTRSWLLSPARFGLEIVALNEVTYVVRRIHGSNFQRFEVLVRRREGPVVVINCGKESVDADCLIHELRRRAPQAAFS